MTKPEAQVPGAAPSCPTRHGVTLRVRRHGARARTTLHPGEVMTWYASTTISPHTARSRRLFGGCLSVPRLGCRWASKYLTDGYISAS
jgi:hypothetical protein